MTKGAFKTAVRAAALTLALILGVASTAHGQLTSASASALGMAGNNTAFVTELGAISVNPAGLGLPGSGFSLAIAPAQARLGLAPVRMGDLHTYSGARLPDAVKEEWLQRVVDAGGQSGSVGGDASAFALTLGNVGFQLTTTASTDLNLPPGVVEAALYGNAGRTGEATALSLADAHVDSYLMTTAGMSFALPINEGLVFGITGKYSYGHGLIVGRSVSGVLEADPIRGEMEFPLITSCSEDVSAYCDRDLVEGGSGFGIDLGTMVDLGVVRLGASVQNVVSSFAWDETKLSYRPGTFTFDVGEPAETDYDERPYDEAPEELKAVVEDFTPKPTFRLGAAMDVSPNLTLTGDIHGRLADGGISLEPGYHTGIGAELRLGFLHLWGGITKMTEAMQYGIGTSLVLGPVNLSGALGLRQGELSDTRMAQVGISFGGR